MCCASPYLPSPHHGGEQARKSRLLYATEFVTIDDYLHKLRCITRVLGELGPEAMFYSAAVRGLCVCVCESVSVCVCVCVSESVCGCEITLK